MKSDETVNIDLDLLATHLKNAIETKGLSIRGAAGEIGCSPTTLTRLLHGSVSENIPDSINLIRATSWLGKSLSEFEKEKGSKMSTISDVEVHLRALPGLSKADTEALVGMVKAAYDHANKLPKKKK